MDLSSKNLTGTIPPELGTLFELTVLDLSSNSLTGEIPAELAWLENLVEIRLSGNSLTGCIPVALEGVATNDLNSLSLPYCEAHGPDNLEAAPTSATIMRPSWDRVDNTTNYGVEHRSVVFGLGSSHQRACVGFFGKRGVL